MVHLNEKFLYLFALVGLGFPSIQFGHEMEQRGLARYAGDQFAPDWEWLKLKLNQLALWELQDLYEKACKERCALNQTLGVKNLIL